MPLVLWAGRWGDAAAAADGRSVGEAKLRRQVRSQAQLGNEGRGSFGRIGRIGSRGCRRNGVSRGTAFSMLHIGNERNGTLCRWCPLALAGLNAPGATQGVA